MPLLPSQSRFPRPIRDRPSRAKFAPSYPPWFFFLRSHICGNARLLHNSAYAHRYDQSAGRGNLRFSSSSSGQPNSDWGNSVITLLICRQRKIVGSFSFVGRKDFSLGLIIVGSVLGHKLGDGSIPASGRQKFLERYWDPWVAAF